MKHLKRFLIGLIAAVMCLITPVSTCLAARQLSEEDLYFYGLNGIYFFMSGRERGCYSSTNLSGDTVMAKVVNYLSGNNERGFILSENGIAGILANFEGESGFNPFRFEGDKKSGPGYGIAQFTGEGGINGSPILGPLRSDSRTSNYFNTYFDIKYTKYDSSTGFPIEEVPDDVLDAWLAVQLDYFFGPSSQFETIKVGTYRDLGGTMGLDYITDNMTPHEAMDAARTPEDAARIFVWIMERPKYKSTAAEMRGERASYWAGYVDSILGNSLSPTSASSSNDGSDVTVIGDSITVGSQEKILELMPQADIHAQVSKQFYTGSSENPGGFTILQELAESDSLRGTVVYALGTNSSVTAAQVDEVVKTAGESRKVVFVTNYSTSNDFLGNNNNYSKAKNSYSNVSIADWKARVQSQPSEYLGVDGVHPNTKGQETFARIITSAASGAETIVSVCKIGTVNGGLTEEQAQRLADYYNGPAVDASWLAVGTKNNCVSFSQWFTVFFTGLPWVLGDGKDVAHALSVARGLERGNEPRPFAVFSVYSPGSTYGHTGIVVAVNGDDITTIEAAYNRETGGHNAWVVHRKFSSGYFQNTLYGSPFTYLDSLVDLGKLADIVGN
jgi:surface antigen